MMKKKSLIFLTLPTSVLVLGVLVLMNWRVPTRVQVDLTVNRAVFSLSGTDSSEILNPVSFKTITIEKYGRIKLEPEKLEVADPGQYNPMEDRYPESAWTTLSFRPPLVITGMDETLQPAVTLQSARQESATAGILDRVWAGPESDVTLELRGNRATNITIKLDGQTPSAILPLREPFRMTIDFGRVSGITELPHQTDSLTYRAQLPEYSREMEITGEPSSLVLLVIISPEQGTEIFSKNFIPVEALDFTRLNAKGEYETTVVRDGRISYPDYPEIEEVVLRGSDFVKLGKLNDFYIERIALDQDNNGIVFRLHGIAGYIKSGAHGFSKDHRLSAFDKLWNNPRLVILFSIIIWVFPTTVGAYRLFKELKG